MLDHPGDPGYGYYRLANILAAINHYTSFPFKQYETPHFRIYHYVENKESLNRIASWSEEWYRMHQKSISGYFLL